MISEISQLETLVQRVLATIAAPADADAPPASQATMRERFFELMVLGLANLYGKIPVAGTLFDRSTLKFVTEGLDDNESGKFSSRADDWIRLEGLVRVMEGQKSYTLNRPSLAVLCTPTSQGTLGDVMEGIAAIYANPGPTPQLRVVTRDIAAYFMTRLGRS